MYFSISTLVKEKKSNFKKKQNSKHKTCGEKKGQKEGRNALWQVSGRRENTTNVKM